MASSEISRRIYTSFWTDPKVQEEMTPEDRYFYLYLLTNPHTSLSGCYEISFKAMSDETGYTKETLLKLVERMETQHNVIRYDRKSYEMLILNWHRYNWTRSPKLVEGVKYSAESIKTPAFKSYIEALLEADDTVCIQYPYIMDTSISTSITTSTSSSKSITKTSNKKNIEKKKYGSFQNVFLTDDELVKLQDRFPDWQERIDEMSEGIASRKYKYESHYAAILSWARRDAKQNAPKKNKTAQMLDESFEMMDRWANG